MQQLETDYMPRLNVPYRSQREVGIIENYGTRGCGVTALSMVLEYYGHHLSGSDLRLLSDQTHAYQGEIGWTHAGLVKIARKLGLLGYRINYDYKTDEDLRKSDEILREEGASASEFEMFKKSFEFARSEGGYSDICRLISQRIPVIASLIPEYTGLSYSHLVVVTEIDEKGMVVNDPWNNGRNFQISREEFEKYWTNRVVIIYDGGTRK